MKAESYGDLRTETERFVQTMQYIAYLFAFAQLYCGYR